MGERSGCWAGFRAECLGWRGVGSWVDGWLKGWESRVIGFGWSEPQLERAMLQRDIALHVVAAHHGRARPHFPTHERFDPELPDAVVVDIVQQVPLRFDRLQRKYGRWGLAWMESLLRAADVLGSDDGEVKQ